MTDDNGCGAPRVLLIGIRPEAVDFLDPDLPSGLTAEKIAAGIAATTADMRQRGWNASFCAVPVTGDIEPALATAIEGRVDCVVIGGGIRMPARNLLLFELVINAVHRLAPNAAIAFNTAPDNSADAAARWLDCKPITNS